MKIALVGAFDRNNYGDVLMPIVFEKRFIDNYKSEVCFEYFGLQESNLENIGGLKTQPLSLLYENKIEYDCVIIVGGEVLSSRYTNMYLNLKQNYFTILFYKFLRKIFPKYVEKMCRNKLRGKEKYPWVLDKSKLNCNHLIYNSVGGKDIEKTTEIFNIVSKFDYISLRDKETFDALKNMNNNAFLFPDSVISVSKVINDEELNNKVDKNLMTKLRSYDKYLVLQVKKKIGDEICDKLVEEIEKLYNEYKLPCVLLPIGYAQGHEDHIVLRKISSKLKTESLLITNNSIYDTIYIIKNSSCYVGTSLHGAITAISYCVPHMALTNKVYKLIDFLETWGTTAISYTEPYDLSENVISLIKNENNIRNLGEVREEILLKSDENFEKIYDIIVSKK